MAVASVHLMPVSLNIVDTPVGYSPPVGPSVQFTVRYNQREARQPANFSYANFSSKWTCDWISYITDNPQSPLANVAYYARGGGTRTFTGFNTNTQTYAFEQFDQTQLKRTSTTHAPWTILRSEDKHLARLNAMRVILNAVDYDDRDNNVDFVPDPAVVVPAAQEIATMEAERIRSGKFAE